MIRPLAYHSVIICHTCKIAGASLVAVGHTDLEGVVINLGDQDVTIEFFVEKLEQRETIGQSGIRLAQDVVWVSDPGI